VAGDALSREQSLAGIPMFAGVDEDLREESPWAELASRAAPASIAAGEWLWHQGDPGDSLYVILTGRLEVVVEQPERRVIRVLGRGGAVGELALLTASPRSAGVRATRDSELLRVGCDEFTEVLDSRPEFARALTRELGRQLRDVRHAGTDPDPIPSTIAVVALAGGLPVRDVAGYLTLLLGRWRSVVALDGGEVQAGARLARVLDLAEREHQQVVLVAPEPDSADRWTGFCLRQADRVIAVAGPDGNRPPPMAGADLLVLGDGGRAGRDALVSALDPRTVSVVPEPGAHAPAVERLARRLAGRSVGLVLSGGGARAFAHLGVLAELERAGIEVDRVAGTSGGAYIGAQYALGRTPEEILAVCRREFVVDNPLNDYTLPLVSLARNRKGLAMLARTFGETRFEELEREFFCVSCDMGTAKQVVHRRGPLAQCVGASMTLPGVLPPFSWEGRLLLDGGVLNNMPVDVMAASGEGPIVAVDVSAHFELPAGSPSRFRRARLARLAARARGWVVGSEGTLPSFGETITRAIMLGSLDTSEAAQRYADVVVTPDVGDYGLLHWDRIDELVEAGRQAARAELAKPAAALLGA
jgi:predicted acylesterase/phospholipase RssA/CRP-like cAMP-binding protein